VKQFFKLSQHWFDNGLAEQLTATELIAGQTKIMFAELVQDNYANSTH